MLCNFLGCVKIVFEMNFVKNALLTMGNDTYNTWEWQQSKIMKLLKLFDAPTK